MKTALSTPTLLLACTLALACGTDAVEHSTGDARAESGHSDGKPAPDRGADGSFGPVLSIYIRGDKTARTFSDGWSGQTPKVYKMGLARYEALRSTTDPSPVVVFDHGTKPVDVDLLGETLGGKARIASLPSGTYTHGRVLLTSSTFTVAATVHAGLSLPGEITVVTALSDTTINGKAWTQGQATFTFTAGATQHTIPAVLPLLPSTGGGTIVQQGGKAWLLFPFPTPLTLSSSDTKDRKATIIYQVFESFRWEEQVKGAFASGVFDVDGLGLTWEPVKNYGATGYSVEVH